MVDITNISYEFQPRTHRRGGFSNHTMWIHTFFLDRNSIIGFDISFQIGKALKRKFSRHQSHSRVVQVRTSTMYYSEAFQRITLSEFKRLGGLEKEIKLTKINRKLIHQRPCESHKFMNFDFNLLRNMKYNAGKIISQET